MDSANLDILTALSELGVMFLLFRVGLEVKSSELMRVGGVASLVAVLGVLVPLVLGWGIMRAAGYPQVESIFVGAAMVATSVGITAQVLAARGLLHCISSKIILAAAVIDDILGLIVLAIVSSMAKGSVNLIEIGRTAALAIGFTILVATFGTRTAARLVPAAGQQLRAGETQFNIALVLLFGLSVLAIYAGVAAIIGAFLAGMALAESVEARVHDLAHGISELLVPFFLAGIGLHLDVSVFADRGLLMLSLAILLPRSFRNWWAADLERLRWAGEACCRSDSAWFREARLAWWSRTWTDAGGDREAGLCSGGFHGGRDDAYRSSPACGSFPRLGSGKNRGAVSHRVEERSSDRARYT